MARNNEDRFGAPHVEAPPPPIIGTNEAASNEQAFSFVTPTEFVELPSRGKFYSDDHPLHNQESIEIRYMTAKDEDILTSNALIRKGVALDRLLQNVIVDKRIKADDLLVGDRNAILVATRISGYGESYDVKMSCPTCFSSVEHGFDLSKLNVQYGDNLEEHDIILASDNTFLITLPKTKAEVNLRLMTGTDERDLGKLAQTRKKHKLPESSLTDQFKKIIVAVNGSANKSHINELVDCLPAADSRYLRNLYFATIPNIDLRQDFECNSCGAFEEVMIPFTTEFFWPKR